MLIKFSDFIPSTTVPIFYIYKIEKNSDNAIGKIYFYQYSGKDQQFMAYFTTVEWLSKQLCNFECFACCGKFIDRNGARYFTRLGIVIPMIQDGKFFLKTISDDSTSNNLLSLEEAYSIN